MLSIYRSVFSLIYTHFILVRLCRKLLAYLNSLESVPGTNQYWAMNVVSSLAQGNIGLHLTKLEPMRLAIIRLLVRRVTFSSLLASSITVGFFMIICMNI